MIEKGSSVHKIYLVGAPGSGKSFLAERLSQTLGIPWYDLDSDEFARMDSQLHRERFWQIQQQEMWICEAVYGGVSLDWVGLADVSVILTPPRLVRMWRVAARALAKKRGVEFPGQPGRDTWASLKYRLGGTWYYERDVLEPFMATIQAAALPVLCIPDNVQALRAIVSATARLAVGARV